MLKWFILVILCLSAGCSSPTPLPAKPGKQLRLTTFSDPATLDPRRGGDTTSSTIHFLLFEGLMRLNPDGTVSPAQAESIDISPDKTIYTFHLRTTYWSDGTPVTAHDFEQAWKDILSPSFPAPNAHLLYPIRGAKQVKMGQLPIEQVGIHSADSHTLIIELNEPTPYFLELTSFCALYPVAYIHDRTDTEGISSHLLSNGPFVLGRWKHNDEIVLVKNELYWNKEQIPLQEIQIFVIENEMTALQMYENDEIDMLGGCLTPVPRDALTKLQNKQELHIAPLAATSLCAFNTQAFPFYNGNLRKAFAYAINRQSIVDNITQLKEPIALSAIAPVLRNKTSPPLFTDHDLSTARTLFDLALQELNIEPQDLNLTYYYTNTAVGRQIAQALQQEWFEVFGIQVKIENMETKVLLDQLYQGNFIMAQGTWIAQYNDPMNILERFKFRTNAKNYSGWENERYKELLEASMRASTQQQRQDLLEEAERILIDEMPFAPIYHLNTAVLAKPYLTQIQFTPLGTLCLERIDKL